MAVDDLYTHVALCQKRFEVSQKLQENSASTQVLIDKIRKKELDLSSKMKKSKPIGINRGYEPLDMERFQVELYRKMLRVLEGQLVKKRLSGPNNDAFLIA